MTYRRGFRRRLIGLLAALISAFAAAPAGAAAKAELWDRWLAHDPASIETVDHRAWDRWLAAYVRSGTDGINRVAYGKVTKADRKALKAYLGSLAATRISLLARPEQQAFWVNLYNALTVKVVLDHYPVGSITDIDISPGLFSNGPWGKELIVVEEEALTLDAIEHRILRPIWQDPRLHYALNCASLGCPNLQARAMTAANAETFLDDAARAYINHPRGAEISDGKLTVSSIYEWYMDDFGDSEADVIAHLKRYAEAPLAKALDGIRAIEEYRYDWALNEAVQ